MKVKILGNLSYQTHPIVDDMVEIDDELLKRIGTDKQFDSEGYVVEYLDNNKKIVYVSNNVEDVLGIKRENKSDEQIVFEISCPGKHVKQCPVVDEQVLHTSLHFLHLSKPLLSA